MYMDPRAGGPVGRMHARASLSSAAGISAGFGFRIVRKATLGLRVDRFEIGDQQQRRAGRPRRGIDHRGPLLGARRAPLARVGLPWWPTASPRRRGGCATGHTDARGGGAVVPSPAMSPARSPSTTRRSPDAAERARLRRSIRRRVTTLNRALGDPWRGEFAYLAVDPTEHRAPPPALSTALLARIDALLHAIAIALQITQRSPGFDDDDRAAWRAQDKWAVERIRLGDVRNRDELDYLVEVQLEFWRREHDADTRTFWMRVAAAGLPFARRAPRANRAMAATARAILARGAIANRAEHEFAVDAIVLLTTSGDLDAAQGRRLASLIGAYERRRARSPKGAALPARHR